jgi:hypothetical protein
MSKPLELAKVINKKYGVDLLGKSRKDPLPDLRVCYFILLLSTRLYKEKAIIKIMNKNRTLAYHYREGRERMVFDKKLVALYNEIKTLHLEL